MATTKLDRDLARVAVYAAQRGLVKPTRLGIVRAVREMESRIRTLEKAQAYEVGVGQSK